MDWKEKRLQRLGILVPRKTMPRQFNGSLNLSVSIFLAVRGRQRPEKKKHEANYLKLDISKAKMKLKWLPKWGSEEALRATVDWYQAFQSGKNMNEFTYNQISSYESLQA